MMALLRPSSRSSLWPRAGAFAVWALVAAVALFWALRLGGSPLATPPHAKPVALDAAAAGDLARVLGGPPPASVAVQAAAPSAPGRFRLVGVAAPKVEGSGAGVALIAIDDKPARAFRVGAVVDGDTVLQSVQARLAELGPRGAPASVRLELPALPPPATGVPGAGGAAAVGAARIPLPPLPMPSRVPNLGPVLPPTGVAGGPGAPPNAAAPYPLPVMPNPYPQAPASPYPQGAPPMPPMNPPQDTVEGS